MDERFVHLRDKNGKLKASIGYLRPDEDDNVKYAVLVVSPSEPEKAVTLRDARHKLRGRLRSKVTPPKTGICIPRVKVRPMGRADWGVYKRNDRDIDHTHGEVSAFEFIRHNAGLRKIGTLKKERLKTYINTLRQQIAELK